MTAAAAPLDPTVIRPQRGPQERFLQSRADIAITGGSAFGGKTFALLLDPTRHIHVPQFSAVMFRRLSPDIRAPGGLWPESLNLYPHLGSEYREGYLDHRFPSGAIIKFSHLQYDNDVLNWKGSQVTEIEFDQLEEFSAYQFWYMMSRNRSTCGVKPRIRATCNPDPDSWLAAFIAWWIDQDTGFAIPERSGILRWFVRPDDELEWADDPATLRKAHPELEPVSVTFIPSNIKNNPLGTKADPAYEGKLQALPYVERMRLLHGNWKVRPGAGKVFNRAWFKPVEHMPVRVTGRVRYWDKAATKDGDGAESCGVRMSVTGSGDQRQFYIEDCVAGRWSAMERENVIKQCAQGDPEGTVIVTEQEPGSGGKESADNTIRNLAGYTVRKDKVTGDKFERAGPFGAQAEAGNIFYVRGDWNEGFLTQLHNADPNIKKQRRDKMDAGSGAFNRLAKGSIHDAAPPIPIPQSNPWIVE